MLSKIAIVVVTDLQAKMARRKKSRRANNSSPQNSGSFGQRVSIKPSSDNSDNNNVFQMDRILCRAYSLDSNISDLSGSIGANRSRGAAIRKSNREEENIFMSILNDCATLTGIAEFVAEGQAALTGTASDDKKPKRSSGKKPSQPNVWGVSPTVDDDSDDDSTKLKKKLEREEELVNHDNIELVLDDNFKTSANKKTPSRKLKSRVSSVLRRQSPAPGGENASSTNDEVGPSLLAANGNAGQGSTGKTSNPVPTSEVDVAEAGSTASSQKKSSRKLFRFPLNPARKSISAKKKSADTKQATKEQIEEAKNWESTLDKATGKTYYYNKKTKETVWEKPVGYDEVRKELASSEKEEGAPELWKATVDQSTGKTYYYNKKTKEVSWTIPKGFKESVRGQKKVKNNGGEIKAEGDGSDIAKYWRETVDASTGKTYYFNKKTKEVTWEKPAGFGEKIDENVPLTKSQPAPGNNDYDTPFDEEPPDAPFDEPDGAPAPKKAHFGADNNADETPDAMSLYSRTKSLKSIELTKQRTYASAMTDTTKKVTNTGVPARDFTNTHINVIKDNEDEGSSHNSASPKISLTRGQANPTKSSTHNDGKTPVVSPPSTPKRRYRTKKAENLGSDDDSDFDDWSDEVSELSGFGNDVNREKSSRNKLPKDSRTETSSLRDSAALDNSAERKEDPKNWSKEQLDSFISKNDWGQVAKYIAESRKTSQGVVPQRKVGGMTTMQQDISSQVSADDDSVWQSLDDTSNVGQEDKDASFDYDNVAARQTVPAVQ